MPLLATVTVYRVDERPPCAMRLSGPESAILLELRRTMEEDVQKVPRLSINWRQLEANEFTN